AAAGRVDGSTAVAGSDPAAARSADVPATDGSGPRRTPTLPGAPPRDPRRRRRPALLAGLVVLVLVGIAAARADAAPRPGQWSRRAGRPSQRSGGPSQRSGRPRGRR